jgi:hypothetical protein
MMGILLLILVELNRVDWGFGHLEIVGDRFDVMVVVK